MKKLKKYFEQKFFKINTKNLLGFAFLWLTNGFFLGTLTLLGPVEYISAWARKNNYNQNIENLLIKLSKIKYIFSNIYSKIVLLLYWIKLSIYIFR